jgi:hypothetical protein
MTLRGRSADQGPGFWIPDAAIDALIAGGPNAFAVYALAGSAERGDVYLAPWRMGELLGLREEHVWDAVQHLYDEGVLNDFDVRMLHAACLADPQPDDAPPGLLLASEPPEPRDSLPGGEGTFAA